MHQVHQVHRKFTRTRRLTDSGTLAALALLLADLRTDAEALRELLAGAEPTAVHAVASDALALMSWRLAFGQGIATDAADTTSAAARQFIGAAVLQRVGGAA